MDYEQALHETLEEINQWIDSRDLKPATKEETKVMTGFMHMFLSVLHKKLESK